MQMASTQEGTVGAQRCRRRCLRLRKDIYGLKQAGRFWNQQFSTTLVEDLGFQHSLDDPCLLRKDLDGTKDHLFISIDDCVLAGTGNAPMLVAQQILEKYEGRLIGDLEWFLSMRVRRDRSRRLISLDQPLYISKVLEQYGMMDCNPCCTPMEKGAKLDEVSQLHECPYAQLVGSLMYAAVGTRPESATPSRPLRGT